MPLSDDEMIALLRDPARHSPSARLMGFDLLDLSSADGWVEVAFTPRPEFANPAGFVQGGFICAMLDDAMAVAASVSQGFTIILPTLQISVSYLRPTPIARVIARGEVLRISGATAQMHGGLRLPDGTELAVATAAAVVRPFPPRDASAAR